MKKVACVFLCFLMLIFAVSCANNTAVEDGYYFAEGDYELGFTPFISLDINKKGFSMSSGLLSSFAEIGTYEIENGVLIANSQTAVYKFEIKDQNTIILTYNNNPEFFKNLINKKFKFSKDITNFSGK